MTMSFMEKSVAAFVDACEEMLKKRDRKEPDVVNDKPPTKPASQVLANPPKFEEVICAMGYTRTDLKRFIKEQADGKTIPELVKDFLKMTFTEATTRSEIQKMIEHGELHVDKKFRLWNNWFDTGTFSLDKLASEEHVHGSVVKRPEWHQVWMEVAQTISKRSCDPRLKVGAIIVSSDNTRMLSLGYNGGYKGGPNQPASLEPGKSEFVHAEQNAIIKCDYNFNKPKVMYVTHSPCPDCARIIINADISRVIYGELYRDTRGIDILNLAGVEVSNLESAK